MKIKLSLLTAAVSLVLGLLVWLAPTTPTVYAQATGVTPAQMGNQPDTAYQAIQFTGIPASLPTQSVSNSFTSSVFVLKPGKPLSIWFTTSGTNAGMTSNSIAIFQLGYDRTGTNFATTPTLSVTNAGNGTNTVISLTMFNTNQLLGARTIRVFQLSNTNIYTGPLRIVAGQER